MEKDLISPVWNIILKIWDTFFELMQRETMQQKIISQFFRNMKLELWKGRLTWDNKIKAQS